MCVIKHSGFIICINMYNGFSNHYHSKGFNVYKYNAWFHIYIATQLYLHTPLSAQSLLSRLGACRHGPTIWTLRPVQPSCLSFWLSSV